VISSKWEFFSGLLIWRATLSSSLRSRKGADERADLGRDIVSVLRRLAVQLSGVG